MSEHVNCQMPGQAHRVKNCRLSADCAMTGVCAHADFERYTKHHEQAMREQAKAMEEYAKAADAEERVAAMKAAYDEAILAREMAKDVEAALREKDTAPVQMLPVDSQERKNTPICTGVLDYFPLALAAVARLSKMGNDKHNPGQPLHWSRNKSSDHADCIAKHLVDRGIVDPDTNLSHSVALAWRALALLEVEEEQRLGLPPSRGSR